MIVDKIERNIFTSGNIVESSMGLAEGSEAFVFGVLRKDLYSDPIKSLLREYTVNAQDEHRRIGKGDVPIEITFPNHLSPELHIRDFARGLTEDEVRHFFGKYGASDKRESNDVVGFFGLGCKSAFAYTDAFVVTSFKDGVKMTFNIYIDETEVGKVALMGSEPTDEPNGLRISVPVKTYDCYAFVNKGFETIKYFKTQPIIKGVAQQPELDKRKSIISGDNWIYFGGGDAIALMGEIAYPINIQAMGDLQSWERSLLQSGLMILTNIGEVQVTASREALQMSDKTKDAIKARLAEIRDEMISQTETAFKECKTILEAKSLYHDTILNGGGFGNILRMSGQGITWNGQKIADNIIRLEQTPHSILTYSKASWKKNIDTYREQRLVCSGDLDLYFDDTDGKIINYKRRAKTLIDAGAKNVVIIQTTDVKALEKLLGFKVSELKSYNAVVPTIIASTRGGNGVDLKKRAKHQRRVFQLDLKKLNSFYGGAASDVWTPQNVDVDNTPALYVPIERFQPKVEKMMSKITELKSVLNSLEKFGVKARLPIYGIKSGEPTGKLVRFDIWLTKKVGRLRQIHEEAALVEAFRFGRLFNVLNINEDELPESDAKSYISLYKKAKGLYNSQDTRDRDALLRLSGKSVVMSQELVDLSDKFRATYPVLELVPEWNRGNKTAIEYIKEKISE